MHAPQLGDAVDIVILLVAVERGAVVARRRDRARQQFASNGRGRRRCCLRPSACSSGRDSGATTSSSVSGSPSSTRSLELLVRADDRINETNGVANGDCRAGLEICKKFDLQLDFLADLRPGPAIAVRHTVGLVDPIVGSDQKSRERADDGLPETLEEVVEPVSRPLLQAEGRRKHRSRPRPFDANRRRARSRRGGLPDDARRQ